MLQKSIPFLFHGLHQSATKPKNKTKVHCAQSSDLNPDSCPIGPKKHKSLHIVCMCTLLEVLPDRSSQTQQDLKAFLSRIVKSLGPSICHLATIYDWQSIYTADICCVCAVGGVMSHKELYYTC